MPTRAVRSAIAFAGCLFLGTSIASAQATRTWVSGVGDDVNPCSRTAPCKTFAGAISKTAAGGEIDALDSGGFGAVTITKAMTINGMGTDASILTPGQNGITINAGPGDTVVLRNLNLQGAMSGLIGIRVLAGATVVVDNVTVAGFGTGIEANDSNVVITKSSIVSQSLFGIHAKGGTITIESSMLTGNNVAVQATSPGTVRLSDNGIYNNATGFGCGGGALISANNNRKGGNTGGVVPTCAPTMSIVIQ